MTGGLGTLAEALALAAGLATLACRTARPAALAIAAQSVCVALAALATASAGHQLGPLVIAALAPAPLPVLLARPQAAKMPPIPPGWLAAAAAASLGLSLALPGQALLLPGLVTLAAATRLAGGSWLGLIALGNGLTLLALHGPAGGVWRIAIPLLTLLPPLLSALPTLPHRLGRAMPAPARETLAMLLSIAAGGTGHAWESYALLQASVIVASFGRDEGLPAGTAATGLLLFGLVLDGSTQWSAPHAGLAMACLIVALAARAGLLPFADRQSAPATLPVARLVGLTGPMLCLLRLSFSGGGDALTALGVLCLVLAAISLWGVTGRPRRLDLSTSQHLALVTAAFGMGGEARLAGLLHLAVHLFVKGAALVARRPAELGWTMLAATGAPPAGLFATASLILLAASRRSLPLAAVIAAALWLGGTALLSRVRLAAPGRPGPPALAKIWLPLALSALLGFGVPVAAAAGLLAALH